jgi:hypothetical protein
LGYIDDLRDPIEVARPGIGAVGFGTSSVAAARMDADA